MNSVASCLAAEQATIERCAKVADEARTAFEHERSLARDGDGDWYAAGKRDGAINIATAIRALATPVAVPEGAGGEEQARWRPISEAPKDGTVFIAYSQEARPGGLEPLPPFVSLCSWHEEAGFCTDELREPTHFVLLPTAPIASSSVVE